MALVSNGFVGYVTLIDSGGDSSTLSYQLVAADAAAAATAMGTILTALGAVTDAAVKSYSVAEVFVENALTFPLAGTHVENRAVVTVQIDGEPLKKSTVVIPAPDVGIFVASVGPNSNVVDIADAALVSYIDIWRTTGALAKLSDGETVQDVDGIIKGVRTHRKSSNG